MSTLASPPFETRARRHPHAADAGATAALRVAWLYDMNACVRPTGVTRHALAQGEQLALRRDVALCRVAGKISTAEGRKAWDDVRGERRQLPLATRDMLRLWRLASGPPIEWWSGAVDWIYCPSEYFVPTRSAKLAVTSHDVLQDLTYGSPRRRALLERVFRRADRILSVSHFNTAQLLDAFPQTAGKIAHVPNAAEDIFFQPASPGERAAVRSDLGVPEGVPYLLSVANFQPRKNLERFLRAMARLREVIDGELAIVMIGAGAADQEAALRAVIAEMPPRVIVRLAGYREGIRLRAAYAEATALVFPSLCESFGIPAAEAMAQGCPVALADSTALPEIAETAGWYFDPRLEDDITATVRTLLDHPAEAARRAGIGRKRARRFQWTESCRVLVQALRSH